LMSWMESLSDAQIDHLEAFVQAWETSPGAPALIQTAVLVAVANGR
jgi:hypothetical protein